MTLKDYEFLISTMETIVSLDIKSEALNGEKREMMSKKTILDDEIRIITNRIEELNARKNSTYNPDSLKNIIEKQESFISNNRLEIKELKRKISKLDGKISSRTMGKTYEQWKESGWANDSIIFLLTLSTIVALLPFIVVIIGLGFFAESFNEIFSEYFWYIFAAFFVPFFAMFVPMLNLRAEEKKDMPDIENWERQRKKLISDLEFINEIKDKKIRSNKDLSDKIGEIESIEENLRVEEEILESHRVPLRELLGEIEAIEAEVSRINDEIVNSLESVAHLTPYNSGF